MAKRKSKSFNFLKKQKREKSKIKMKSFHEDGFFFRVFYRSLALLLLGVLLFAFIALSQNNQTTLAENGENLISAQPRISAHSQGPKM